VGRRVRPWLAAPLGRAGTRRSGHVCGTFRSELYGRAFNAHEVFGSLPRRLRPTFDSFPRRDCGFLVADPRRAGELRARLTEGDGRLVVGLSWSSANTKVGRFKSAQLRDFEPLLRLPGCRFVDLQYGDTQAERETVARELGITIERLEVDNRNDIDGLSALMSACDAVVTTSNTTPHLAGALGCPTWVMVPRGRGRFWYWFKDRPDSPWYPQVRVRPIAQGQSWADLVSAIADEVGQWRAAGGAAARRTKDV